MTQEDKDLLLKDLCGRLPYRMRFKTKHGYDTLEAIDCYDLLDIRINTGNEDEYSLDEIKPYLFPLPNMKGYLDNFYKKNDCWTIETFDWFNRNHIDYRGLIEKGLAIDATDLNIY